jgi:hypothetical protein
MHKASLIAFTLTLLLFLATALPASAHRPYFEDKDIVASSPWKIDDPTISTVVYATLGSSRDVDYYAFDGKKGQRILLEITIPQIVGQDEFAPTLALMGPGLPSGRLPSQVERPAQAGAQVIPSPAGAVTSFYEPFSRTSYWERQSQRVTLPADGRYVVAIWHPTGELGRYGFVIGDRELPGGQLIGLGKKLKAYWTPVTP